MRSWEGILGEGTMSRGKRITDVQRLKWIFENCAPLMRWFRDGEFPLAEMIRNKEELNEAMKKPGRRR